MGYLRFVFDTKKMKLDEPFIRIYPIACLHIGAAQSDFKFIEEHLKRVKDDTSARWIYMGDGGECVTKQSKGDISAQLLNPQLQMEMLCDLLAPIKERGLFGIRGNHGHRIYKENGLSFDHNLCTILGIPYMGAATFVNFTVNRSSYDGYFHHGIDSGVTLKSKIQKAEAFGHFINADMIVTAHSHIAVELHPITLLGCDNHARKTSTKLRHQYIVGSAYDSRTGYAEDKGYPPLLPSMLSIKLDGRIIEGKAISQQSSHIYRSDGQHKLEHPYLSHYLEQEDVE